MQAPVPSLAQRDAIQSPMGAVLVVAGPGAGKTFCLIERIRWLIDHHHLAPERICAFTFTNKAAGEIAHRLDALGAAASQVVSGTIHAWCATQLRVHGAHVGLKRGFGIADEPYQLAVLSRLGVAEKFRRDLLNRFSRARVLNSPLGPYDEQKRAAYDRWLATRNIVDFDALITHAEGLFDHPQVAEVLRGLYDYVLVDEFQDLNPVQFRLIRQLVAKHGNLFAVGDQDQSIFTWAGADPRIFERFGEEFPACHRVPLKDNRRCPREVVHLARRLIEGAQIDLPLSSADSVGHDSPFPVDVRSFDAGALEIAWLLDDLQRDREAHGFSWGEVAVLYRTNRMGGALETEFLRLGIPCRMAEGRALADDPVVAYLIAALRVIAEPADPARETEFLRVVLPHTLYHEAASRADARGSSALAQLMEIARERPAGSEDARKIRRGFYELRNLAAIGQRHHRLDLLVQELLSQRVGQYRSVLEERHDEFADPATSAEAVRIADQLRLAVEQQRPVEFLTAPAVAIALRNMLRAARHRALLLERPHPAGPIVIAEDDAKELGLPTALFKALQYNATREFTNVFSDFTSFDIESTGTDPERARIIEMAAVRVRGGVIVETWTTLVNPGCTIPSEASRIHGITDAMVGDAPAFADVWPTLRSFIGSDVVIAHNGYQYDFPLLRREVRTLGEELSISTFDTLPLARELHPGSRKLADLAHVFGVDPGSSHRALDDTVTLSHVFLALSERKLARARKTALPQLLDHLAVAIVLSEHRSDEARRLLDAGRIFALSRYSTALDDYDREQRQHPGDTTPDRDAVIDMLGGAVLMAKLQAGKDADQRYPETMARVRRLLEDAPTSAPLGEQIASFLETVVLSRFDGVFTSHDRVNLLTLHSTKGLEFSRVYIVGVADEDLAAGSLDRRSREEVEEARRLLYVGMTRTRDRLIMTWARDRDGATRRSLQFLATMGRASA